MPITPDQQRKIDKIVEKMKKNWEIRTNSREIRRINRNPVIRLWYKLILNRYSVWELYRFVYDFFHPDDNNMAINLLDIHFPMKAGDIHLPPDAPRHYQLVEGWSIPSADLGVLIKGPLISADGNSVLVTIERAQDLLIRYAERTLLIILPVLASIITIWNWLISTFRN